MNRSTPGLPVHHQLRSLLKLMSIELVMPSSHLILCHPLLFLPPVPPSTRVFSKKKNSSDSIQKVTQKDQTLNRKKSEEYHTKFILNIFSF